ncbi:MAG: MarR family winged helix-turn-helix transcriptional regulator [Mycobacteriales bacterium]
MARIDVITPPIEDVSTELVTLIRGLRELHVAIVDVGGVPVEMSAVSMLARLSCMAPARLSTVAAAMYLDLSTVSRQVPVLERHGWVVRSTDPNDRRAQLLDLTPAGRDTLEEIHRARADVLSRLLPEWSEDDLRAFAQQLSRFNTDVTTNRPHVLPATDTTSQERV